MKPLILVVDDNPGVLLNLRVTLEFNKYEVQTATNGLEGLDLLSSMKQLPDLILSDVKMPEMGGYDFFQAVSANPNWAVIPFIFLSARTAPDDIRLGMMLGADEYLTKPFKEEELLTTIVGKLAKTHKLVSLRKEIETRLDAFDIDLSPLFTEQDKPSVWLFLALWDKLMGPEVTKCYPSKIQFQPVSNKTKKTVSIQSLGLQLYQAATELYGWEGLVDAQGLLITIDSLRISGYIYFDTYWDYDVKGGQRQYMLSVVAPSITYFNSFQIKALFKEISVKLKSTKDFNIQDSWKQISEIFTPPIE